MLLSLVFATYNRSAFLETTLRGLADQTDKDFEVVVVSDGSTDNTSQMVEALAQIVPYALRCVDTHCDDYGLAVARNLGIIEARGDAVVILDDDSVPDPQFVAAHKQGVARNVITGGPRVPNDPADERMAWKAKMLDAVDHLVPLSIEDHRRKWPNAYLIENNICLYRDDFIRLGMFSERLKIYGFIGQEFFERAMHEGFQFQVNRDATIMHHGEIEGDNGLFRNKKSRQILRASYALPSLNRPVHYQAQIKWAALLASNSSEITSFNWPDYKRYMIMVAPMTLARKLKPVIKTMLRKLIRAGR